MGYGLKEAASCVKCRDLSTNLYHPERHWPVSEFQQRYMPLENTLGNQWGWNHPIKSDIRVVYTSNHTCDIQPTITSRCDSAQYYSVPTSNRGTEFVNHGLRGGISFSRWPAVGQSAEYCKIERCYRQTTEWDVAKANFLPLENNQYQLSMQRDGEYLGWMEGGFVA